MPCEFEDSLIKQVKYEKSSYALIELVKKYQPMIDNLFKQYFIIGYDKNDWHQEALVVCYDTCKLYDGSSGSKFGSFFKLKFRNRIVDLIRYENADKRRINNIAESLEVNDQIQLIAPSHKYMVELSEDIKSITKEMTALELIVMQFILGKISLEEICDKTGEDAQKIMRIVYDCKRKISKRSLNLS